MKFTCEKETLKSALAVLDLSLLSGTDYSTPVNIRAESSKNKEEVLLTSIGSGLTVQLALLAEVEGKGSWIASVSTLKEVVLVSRFQYMSLSSQPSMSTSDSFGSYISLERLEFVRRIPMENAIDQVQGILFCINGRTVPKRAVELIEKVILLKRLSNKTIEGKSIVPGTALIKIGGNHLEFLSAGFKVKTFTHFY